MCTCLLCTGVHWCASMCIIHMHGTFKMFHLFRMHSDGFRWMMLFQLIFKEPIGFQIFQYIWLDFHLFQSIPSAANAYQHVLLYSSNSQFGCMWFLWIPQGSKLIPLASNGFMQIHKHKCVHLDSKCFPCHVLNSNTFQIGCNYYTGTPPSSNRSHGRAIES